MNTKLLISAAFVLLAGGWTVGPNYQRPNVKLPAQWGEPLAGGVTNHDNLVGAWWKKFHDAELDSLIGRAVTTKLDLRIAEARVRHARAQQGFAEAGYWPTVNVSGAYARQIQSENQPIIGSIPSSSNIPFENCVYQAGFDAAWEIDLLGGKRPRVAAAPAALAAKQVD